MFRSILAAIIIAFILEACASLPEGAKKSLDQTIQDHEDPQSFTYTIISVQKSPNPQEYNDKPEEVWCIIIDRKLTLSGESHFVLWRKGPLWEVQPLEDFHQRVFRYLGCTDW